MSARSEYIQNGLREFCDHIFHPNFSLEHVAQMGLEGQIEVLGHDLAKVGAHRLLSLATIPAESRPDALFQILRSR